MAEKNEKKGFINGFIRFSDRWVPNSMVLVMLLTIVVSILVLIICRVPLFTSTETQTSLIDAWTSGFWVLLQFSMQMALVMVSGYALAATPPIKKILVKLAALPNNTLQALLLISLIGAITNFIHWGVGLMGGILIGREILAQAKKKGYKLHKYSLIVIVYIMMNAIMSLSHAAPLYAATDGALKSFVTDETFASLLPDSIPLTETVLHPVILIEGILVCVLVFLIAYAMRPKKDEDIVEIDDAFAEEILSESKKIEEQAEKNTPAAWLNNSIWLNLIVGGVGCIWGLKVLITQGFVGLSLNNYNFIVIMLALLLSGTPEKFVKLIINAIESTWGIVIQFPFYGGIFGLISYTGFNEVLVNAFISISTAKTYPMVVYFYSSILNLFVPSGGSKFAIEAPYILSAGQNLGADLARVISAYTWGDMATNMIQPFWALPVMSLFKVKFKDILPYTFVIFAVIYILHLVFILAF